MLTTWTQRVAFVGLSAARGYALARAGSPILGTFKHIPTRYPRPDGTAGTTARPEFPSQPRDRLGACHAQTKQMSEGGWGGGKLSIWLWTDEQLEFRKVSMNMQILEEALEGELVERTNQRVPRFQFSGFFRLSRPVEAGQA